MRPTRLALLGFLLLALGALPRGAHAEDEMEGPPASRTILLGPATILASPGTPRALDSFLPGGKRPQRLTWPLPDGPLVVLGLPHQDEVAQQVADAFQIDTDDLAGGYRFAAWRTKKRPVVIVMAADAAALAAARFEFDASAPMEMVAPDMRSLDFKRPNQEAGVAVQMGTRHIRPRYAYRAWAPLAPGDPQTLTPEFIAQAAGAHANRLWFRLRDLRAARSADLLARTRRHGIVPVLRVPVGDATVDHTQGDPLAYARLIGSIAEAAFVTHGIRHFAFEFEVDARDLPRRKGSRAACEAALLETLSMEFANAEELLLVPSAHADDLADTAGASLDAAQLAGLRGIKPAVRARMRMAWSGPTSYAPEIAASQARARAKAAGMPLILLDRWAQPFQGKAIPYAPSLPLGRDPALAEVLEGVVVMGRHGTEAMLESTWAPVDGPVGMARLGRTISGSVENGRTWAAAVASLFRASDKETFGLLPWLPGLADELEAARQHLPTGSFLALPYQPHAGLQLDGRLDEQLWQVQHAPIEGDHGASVRLAACDDGLWLGCAVPKAVLEKRELLLRVHVRRPGAKAGIRAEWTTRGWHVDGSLGTEVRLASSAVSTVDGELHSELRLDRFILGGDAHPGRALEFSVSWGPQRLFPWAKAPEARGVLFVRWAD